MTNLRVDVDSDDARRRLRQLGLFLSDLRPFWPRVVPIFIGWMRSQFETEGAWAGHRWAPLSPAYAAYKAQRYPGRSILIAEGDLRQAASRPERKATPTELVLTIRDPKIGYHQTGTARMPARPVVPASLPFEARRELDLEAEAYVRDIARRLGLL